MPHWKPKKPRWYTPEGQAFDKASRAAGKKDGLPWEVLDLPDNQLADGETADQAVKTLNEIKDGPFFLAVGFRKPHTPYTTPRRYWDLYDKTTLPLADNPFLQKDAPKYVVRGPGELNAYGCRGQRVLTDEQARNFVHAYYACVSFIDAQVGRVLDELERLGLHKKTIVVFVSDHGWRLGEHGGWGKDSNHEESIRSPLIVRMPGQQPSQSDGLVELVDIYPTFCDLCGVPLPDGLEGISFKPLIQDPKRTWKKAAFSQRPNVGEAMGYTLRTDRYRFTEWVALGKDLREYELYDHTADPKENVNIANRPENVALVEQLAKQLHDGWKGALPLGIALP